MYTRSGVIRRNRKRKHETNVDTQPSSDGAHSRYEKGIPGDSGNSLQSRLAVDIDVTRERLNGLDAQHNSLSALSSLSAAYSAVWHDAEFSTTGSNYFLFEDRATIWVDGKQYRIPKVVALPLTLFATAFVAALDRGGPLMTSAPQDVLEHLGASCPHQVHERAWLVMYYSIVLSMVSSTNPADESTKTKLRCNLWRALNDVRLFLEPSEVNIQALMLVACHVEEFTTPSLCWMLVTNACRMLQALGVTHRRLDFQTRERRIIMFWHLNIIDKSEALIFGRPPTFHRAMARDTPLPKLDQLLSFQPHHPSTNAPALFGVHYIYQTFLLSRIMADIWECIYEDTGSSNQSAELARTDLESWYRGASKVGHSSTLADSFRLTGSTAS